MRIVRPGTVVGPQQQYMYLKQLEWVKWAAIDELRKQEAETKARMTPAPTAPPKLVTPATPPAEGEDISMNTTPPLAVVPLPPVTPSRHIAPATAKANDIAPPGQPRKTPSTKRAAQDSDDEGESGDILPELGVAPPARKIKTVPASRGGAPSSAPANTRVTRSSLLKKSVVIVPPESPVKPPRQGPNKIPRLAATKTTAASRALALAGSQETIAARTRSQRNPPPSRLPTLVHKRAQSSSLSDVANIKKSSQSSDAWVANNAAAVVAPASKSQRPGLRNVRRRRSSFSSADVVA
jgi:cell division cycle 14